MPMDAFGSPYPDPEPVTGPPYPSPGSPPPNSRWNPTTGTWTTIGPDDPAYDKTWGGKTKGDPREDDWLKSVYEHQGWPLPSVEGPEEPPECPNPPCDPPPPPNGNENGGGTEKPRPFGEVYNEFQAAIPPFTYPDFVPPPGAAFSYRGFEAPAPFAYPDFVAPTGEAVFDDPGYAFRRREGERALENRASALGALRTGGTLKDFLHYNQAFASNEYGNVYDRQVRDWTTGYNTKADTYDRNYRNVLDDYVLGYNRAIGESDRSFNQALQSWQTNFGNAATGHGFDLDLAGLALTGRGQDQGTHQAYLNHLLSLYSLSRPQLPVPAGAPASGSSGSPPGSAVAATGAPAPGLQTPALQAPGAGGMATKSVYRDRDPSAKYYPV